LSAVVRVLDARRLDRHPLGRSLRDALHAHRRLRRSAQGSDADGGDGLAAAAGLGRGAEPRADLHGVRGHPRGDRRGVDAAARPSEVPRRRLLDAAEAATAGAGDGQAAVLLLAFESADHPLDAWMARALECAADHGGRFAPEAGRTRTSGEGEREGAAGAWRRAFLDAPYLRDALVGMGLVTETFETAITWDRFPAFHAAVMTATTDAVRRVCGRGQVTVRFTHAYPDGPAPYYTVLAAGQPRSQLEQWAEIKAAASEAILAAGGTITHHHAVG